MVAISSKITSLNSKTVGILLICGVSFLWGFLEVLVQHIPGGYSIYQIVWFRYATHLLFMLLIFAPRQGLKLIKTKRLGLQLSRSFMMLIMPVSYVIATKYMSARDVLAVFWLLPMMIIILAIFLLRERVSWIHWVAAITGSAILALLLRPNLHVTGLGLLLAFVMGLSFSLYIVMTRMLREESRLTNLFYTGLGVVLPLSFALAFFLEAGHPDCGSNDDRHWAAWLCRALDAR